MSSWWYCEFIQLFVRGHLFTEGVEVLPVKAFRLEPILTGGRHPGHLTVDGELVRTETIQASVMSGAVRTLS